MHGLTGGSWKRSRHPVTATEKNNLTRNRVVPNGSVVYNRTTPPRQFPTLHHLDKESARSDAQAHMQDIITETHRFESSRD